MLPRSVGACHMIQVDVYYANRAISSIMVRVPLLREPSKQLHNKSSALIEIQSITQQCSNVNLFPSTASNNLTLYAYSVTNYTIFSSQHAENVHYLTALPAYQIPTALHVSEGTTLYMVNVLSVRYLVVSYVKGKMILSTARNVTQGIHCLVGTAFSAQLHRPTLHS